MKTLTEQEGSGAAKRPPFWEVANHRRIYLIDRELDGSITPPEKIELDELERATGQLLDITMPLPNAALDDLRSATHQAEERSQSDCRNRGKA